MQAVATRQRGLTFLKHFQGFIHLFKLRIFALLWVESVVGLLLASQLASDLLRLVFLTLAGFLATGGSGALNNFFDRDIDGKMKRTRSRPIPSGSVSPNEALSIGLAMGAGGTALAFFSLGPLSGVMVLSGLLTYSFIYTVLLKRTTPWNIVVGGASGSFAFLAGWAAAQPVTLEAALISLMVFLWTPSHFWALAIKAVDQYRAVGLPMLPVVSGVEKASKAIMANSVVLVGSSLALFALGFFGYVYLLAALTLDGLLLSSDYALMRTSTATAAWIAYKFTAPYLFLMSAAMVLDRLVASFLSTL
jgi:protoheme IX farnesyltransferase